MEGKPAPCSLSSMKTLIQTLLFSAAPPLTLIAQTDDDHDDVDVDIGRILVVSYRFQCSSLLSHVHS